MYKLRSVARIGVVAFFCTLAFPAAAEDELARL